MNPMRCTSVMDGHRCQGVRWHGHRHHWKRDNTGHYWHTDSTKRQTYETAAPWITWTWLSFDRETRITGRSRMRLTCCICGRHEVIRIRIPRWGPVPVPEGGVHAERLRAIERHAHPGQRNPADWALPFRNPAGWGAGIPLSAFENVARTAVMEATEREAEARRGDDEPPYSGRNEADQ